MWAEVIGQLLVVAVVSLAMWWMRRKFPAPELTDNGPKLEELRPKYQIWSVITLFGNMALWIPMTALVFAGLYPLVVWYSATLRDSPDTFVFCLQPIHYLMPAFFVGILLSSFVMVGILKLLLRERFAEFGRFDNQRMGMNQGRLVGVLIPVIGIGFTVVVLRMLNIYLVASPTELRINRPFGLERRYPYSELTAVVTAPASIARSGKRVQHRLYQLQFQDGTSYSTLFMPSRELDGRSEEMLIDAILERSGLTLQEQPVFKAGELEF